ncbi:MAG: vitamin K-dependent gamma-carboxylase [Candidatus Aldehydirespiratoraceae bacterium]|jgi:hypothetical protein
MLTATAEPTAPFGPNPTSLRGRFFERTLPASSFVAFRVAFGLLIVAGQVRFIARGWVDEFYLAPAHHLTYPGFEWVRPLRQVWMYALVGGLALLGVAIAAGKRTRTAAALFAVGFGYCELIDAGLYLNHYWLLTLAALVLAVLPGPIDGRVAAVSVWALRAQLGAVYVFAGVAKLNSDWLLRAEPLQTWLAARTDRPIVGPWLDDPFAAFAFSWAGAAFDLTIVGWLLWRRSRPIAYAVLVAFHVATALLFQIGMFPWVMIALTPIFFAPDWPARFRTRQAAHSYHSQDAPGSRQTSVGRPTIAVLATMVAFNVVLPLRHVATDGNVRWNDDGYVLSWRVMLTERASHVVFRVTDPSEGTTFEVGADYVLEDWQAAAATVRADLILTTAHLIANDLRPLLGDDVEVRADVFVAWNGRLHERWIDPNVELAALDRRSPASTYVLPTP